MVETRWTLTELVALAARALADAEVRVASGRVTGVPDGRLIRWYTTIGLLDRPAIGADRYARYGHRHLLQVVAVKRLQAQGLPIAEIQSRLAGATDALLRRVAGLPPGLTDVDAGAAAESTARSAPDLFWARRPAEAPTVVVTTREDVARVYGLHLGGLTVLLPSEPAPDDIEAIATAARPLLDRLAALDLLTEGAQR